MLKLVIFLVFALSYTFFQKTAKSHMTSYLVTIATDFRQKGTCGKKIQTDKEKKNAEQTTA